LLTYWAKPWHHVTQHKGIICTIRRQLLDGQVPAFDGSAADDICLLISQNAFYKAAGCVPGDSCRIGRVLIANAYFNVLELSWREGVSE
jgi:hypothetical protein